MKIALLPSTQWQNPVSGGGNEAQYAHEVCYSLERQLAKCGHETKIFSAAPEESAWTRGRDANGTGALEAVGWGADLCLSVHSDGGYEPGSHFAALICYQESRRRATAERLLAAYCQRTGYASRGTRQRIPGVNGVAVLRTPEKAGIPAFLLERGWHDRVPDAVDIQTRSTWFAQSICGAILEVYGTGSKTEKEEEEQMKFYVQACALKSPEGWTIYNIPSCHRDWWVDISNEYDNDVRVKVFANPLDKTVDTGGYGEYAVPNTRAQKPGIHAQLHTIAQGLTAEWSEVSIHAERPLSILVGN